VARCLRGGLSIFYEAGVAGGYSARLGPFTQGWVFWRAYRPGAEAILLGLDDSGKRRSALRKIGELGGALKAAGAERPR
jgi:hypothetical protein